VESLVANSKAIVIRQVKQLLAVGVFLIDFTGFENNVRQ